eukprot:799471-Prymnesium_polylepis.1
MRHVACVGPLQHARSAARCCAGGHALPLDSSKPHFRSGHFSGPRGRCVKHSGVLKAPLLHSRPIHVALVPLQLVVRERVAARRDRLRHVPHEGTRVLDRIICRQVEHRVGHQLCEPPRQLVALVALAVALVGEHQDGVVAPVAHRARGTARRLPHRIKGDVRRLVHVASRAQILELRP